MIQKMKKNLTQKERKEERKGKEKPENNENGIMTKNLKCLKSNTKTQKNHAT